VFWGVSSMESPNIEWDAASIGEPIFDYDFHFNSMLAQKAFLEDFCTELMELKAVILVDCWMRDLAAYIVDRTSLELPVQSPVFDYWLNQWLTSTSEGQRVVQQGLLSLNPMFAMVEADIAIFNRNNFEGLLRTKEELDAFVEEYSKTSPDPLSKISYLIE